VIADVQEVAVVVQFRDHIENPLRTSPGQLERSCRRYCSQRCSGASALCLI
jgi:hypothetical protein